MWTGAQIKHKLLYTYTDMASHLGTSSSIASAKNELRSYLAHFLENCAATQACWYRVDSCTFGQMQAVEQGKDPVDSPLPPLSRLMGMENEQSNDLLLACGLLKIWGKETRSSLQGWEDLRSLFQLDIDIEQKKSNRRNN